MERASDGNLDIFSSANYEFAASTPDALAWLFR